MAETKNNPIGSALDRAAKNNTEVETSQNAPAPAATPATQAESVGKALDKAPGAAVVETPVAETPVVETPDTTQTPVAEEPAKEVTGSEVPSTDSFFTDPLKNKAAEGDQPKEDIEALVNEYKQIQADPDFQLFSQYKKAGKSLADLTKDYAVEDYSKMELDALANKFGALKGYTPDQVEEVIAEINGNGPLVQSREIELMRTALEKDQNAKRQTLGGDVQAQAELNNKIRSQFVSEVQQIQGDMVGRDYHGVKLDQSMAKEWADYASKFSLLRADSTIASEMIFESFLATRLLPKIQSMAASKSHHMGREEVLKEISRPVKDAPNNQLPVQGGGDVKHDPKGITKSITTPPSLRAGG